MTATPPALLRGSAKEALSRSTSQRASGSSAGSLEMHGLLFGGSGTGVWLNTRTTPWAAAALKAEDEAGLRLRNVRPAVGIQAREIELWCLCCITPELAPTRV